MAKIKSDSTGLSAVYAAHSTRAFALSLLGIFVPLYIFRILKANHILTTETQILIAVLAYFIVLRSLLLAATLPAAHLIAKVKGGFRKAMFLANCLNAVNLLLLILAADRLYLLIPAAVLGGILVPLYWLPYHLIFVEDGQKASFGRQLSKMAILGKFAAISAPLGGGLIISFAGFETLFIAVLMLVIASTFPLFLMRHHEQHFVPPPRLLARDFWGRNFRANLFAFIGAGAENTGAAIVWPLFLFTIVGSFAGLGAITSGVMLISVLVVWWLGQVVDKKDKEKILKAGAYSRSALWLIRAFVNTIPQAFIAQSLARIAAEFLWLPFDTIVYKKADDGNPFEYLILREWALNLGRLLTLLAVAVLLWFGLGLVLSFVLVAAGTLLTILIVK